MPVAVSALVLACSGKPREEPRSSPTPPLDESRPLPDPLPEAAALVNGQPVPSARLHMLARKLMPPKGSVPVVYRQAMEELINRELLFQEALARGLSADEAALQKAYDEARVEHPDDAEWAQFLKAQFVDPPTYRNELRMRFTIEALVRQEGEKLPAVTDLEIQRFYESHLESFETGEQIQAHQIFFAVAHIGSPRERDAALAKAQEVLARLKKGEDFEAVARLVSQDSASASSGGKLPTFIRGQVEPTVETAAFRLKPGEVSEPILSKVGYHILRVDARLQGTRLSLDEARIRIRNSLVAERQQRALAGLLETLRAKARIERKL